MYPRSFEYARAESLDEALELMSQYGDEARPLAGGMSLVPLMKLRLSSPAVLIDIDSLAQLRTSERRAGAIVLGACVKHAEIARDAELAKLVPILTECAGHIGDTQVRNLGTIGGGLAEADPSGDWGSALIALDARVTIAKKGATRTVAAGDFFVGPFTTALGPDELMTTIEIPVPKERRSGSHSKLERRTGDFAIGIVDFVTSFEGAVLKDTRVVIGAVGATPVRVFAAEKILNGNRPEERTIRAAAEEVYRAVEEPLSDLKASGEFRKEIARTLFARAVEHAGAHR